MMVRNLEYLYNKGKKQYKDKLNILKDLSKLIKAYIEVKNIKDKNKRSLLLLNLTYIGLQLQNIEINDYVHYKIGEITVKYTGVLKLFIQLIIQKYKDKLNITKKDNRKTIINKIFEYAKETQEYKDYKEKLIKIGIKYSKLLVYIFYDKDKKEQLIMKEEI
jgi:hypothetical protein